MSEGAQIKPGQIWREVDHRFSRMARVLSVGKGRRSIQIRTVNSAGDGSAADPHRWEFARHSRPTWCDRERFNGKRGGYELFEDVP